MALYKITECTVWFSVYSIITSKIRPIAIFKTVENKITSRIKLVGVSVIYCCVKLSLSKRNGL